MQAHLDFLPDKQTVFNFTIAGEEFGFTGSLPSMALPCLIIPRGMVIALRCHNQSGRLVALCVASNFFP